MNYFYWDDHPHRLAILDGEWRDKYEKAKRKAELAEPEAPKERPPRQLEIKLNYDFTIHLPGF